MKIHDGIEIVDLALKYKDILIVGDLQLGYEGYLNKAGFLVPRFQFEDAKKMLDKILKKVKINKIIFNGDIKHEFGVISEQEWREVLGIIDMINDSIEIIFVKGNHDIVLGPIARKRGVKLVDYYNVDNITIMHGDKIIPNLSDVLIIGHEHPAISFKERKGEKFKCFLKGDWKGHTLIVMPSFNILNPGSDVSKERQLSPFLKGSLESFEVYIAEDNVYYFGKLKNLK